MTKKQKKNLIRIIASAVLFAAVAAAGRLMPGIPVPVLFGMYLVPYLIAGYDVLIRCVKNLIHGQLLDEAFLMTAATVGAFALSLFYPGKNEYAEAVFVMIFYQTGELFQSVAVGKSRKNISALMDISPDTATVLRGGEEITVLPEEIEPGETLVVRPGEKVPLDGEIVSGETQFDMAALTGESLPFDKKTGDKVQAGSVNLSSVIKIRAEKTYDDSTVAKILELIENSSLNKAKTELSLTKFARIYTPAVVIMAAVLALLGSLLTRQPGVWISRALIFLVVSCPCAIVISVPMAYFGGIGGASANGILIKGSDYLETLADAGTFVFDKTGTLTRGEFSVEKILPENGLTEGELLGIAASAEYYSVHPIGVSVRKAAGENVVKPDKFDNIPGRGVRARIGGAVCLAGRAAFLAENGIEAPAAEQDETAVCVALDGKYIGRVLLADALRENTAAAIDGLKKRGVKHFVMLTGDSPGRAEKIGNALSFDRVYSRLLPADKVEKMHALCENRTGGSVVYVGDGINDAPVLARADVGIALGGIGSDAAIEASDIVIMNDDIGKLPAALCVAVKTRRIVTQNIAFALFVKVLVLVLASAGLAGMWLGAVADVGVAMLCILNSMRTLKGIKNEDGNT